MVGALVGADALCHRSLGHPDPRENARGGDSSMRDPLMSGIRVHTYSIQQNDCFFAHEQSGRRILIDAATSHIRLEDITRMLSGMLEDTSVYASHQLGTRLPLSDQPAGISDRCLAENASQSYGTNHSRGSLREYRRPMVWRLAGSGDTSGNPARVVGTYS